MTNSEVELDERNSRKYLAFLSGTYSYGYGFSEWERIAGTDPRQLQGIDVLVTTTGTVLAIEEKLLCINSLVQYPDVQIEMVHDFPNGKHTLGWIYKAQESDVFCFAWPHQRVSVLVETKRFIEWFRENDKRLQLEYRFLPHTDRYSGKISWCLFIHRDEFINEMKGRVTVIWREGT